MKLNRFLLSTALCISSSLLWVSCQKNGLNQETLLVHPERVVNDVVADDPARLAKVPIIMSADFFERKMHNLLVQAKIAPIKGGPKNGGGSGGGSTIDNTAPTINITSPAAGTNITAGIPVTIAITASDNVGVSSEIFSVDGVQQAGVNGTTASFTWNTTGVTGGTHTITVAAKDVAGNTGIATVVVTVNSTIITPPPPQSSGFEIAMPPITSQGSEGSCVAFAVGYSARSSEQFTKTGATSYSYGTNILSPEYLFDQTKTDPSTCSGSTVLDALDLLKAKGICTWQSMPYSSSNGCSLVPTAAQDAEAANYKITNYSMLYTSDISAVKAMLDMKHPLVFTFNVDSYFYNAGPGFIWKSFSGTIIGGHAAAICGYDDTRHAYKIINSWGTGWGDAGYGWIDYDFMPSVSAMALSLTL